MESGTSTYLYSDDPSMIWYNKYADTFAQEKVVILYISAVKPLDYNLLYDLLNLKKELSYIPGVISTDTIADAIVQVNGGTLPHSQAEIEEAFQHLPENLQTELVPDSAHAIGMVIAEGDPTTLLDPIQTVIDNAELPPGVTIEITGSDAFNEQMVNVMNIQMAILILGAFILMLIALFLLFGSVRYRLLPLLFVMVGLVYLFGLLGLFKIPLNIGAIGAFPVLLGLGIDYAVQFQSRLNDELLHTPLNEAVRTTVCNTGFAVLNAMIATAMGFMALFITPLPMLVSFALAAIVGIICAYAATLFGFPAVAILMNYKAKDPSSEQGRDFFGRYNQILSGLAGKIAKTPYILLILVLMFAGIGMVMDGQIPIDTTEDSMVPADMPAKVVMDKITSLMGSQTPVDLMITASDVTSLQTLQWMDRYGKFMMDVYPNEILEVSSIASVVKQYNEGSLPDSQTALNGIMAQIPEKEKEMYFSGETTALMTFKTSSLSAQQMSDLRKVVLDNIDWVEPPPGLYAYTSGMFELNAVSLDDIVIYKPIMTNIAFLLILLFLIIVYRRIAAIAPMIPIVCVVGWNAVVMWLFSIDYTFITASLGAITIGVSSEYTILMMERYLEERNHSPDQKTAISNSVQKIGASVTVSGLVTAFGFSALLLSTFPIISNFGVMTVIAVVFSLVGAIIIMPAVLSIMGAIEERIIKRKNNGGNNQEG